MDTTKKNYYNWGGLNRDTNPFLMKDSDLLLCTNWYGWKFGAKKVRFGYTAFLDAIDNQPVRNLIYYTLPLEKGIFRVSNSKLYKTTTFTGSWGSSVKTLSADVSLGTAQLNGSVPYVHFSDSTTGYFTYDVSGGIKNWTVSALKPSTLSAWQSRIFADYNKNTLSESAISFDLNSGYTTDPFVLNSNDPSGGGTTPVDGGNGGQIVKITSSIDRINIYKQLGAYKFNGQSFLRMPIFGNILGVATTKNDIDYILTTFGIYKNDGKTVSLASFGLQTVIQDTLRVWGITNPVAFSFNDYTIFYIGNMRVGSGNFAVDITNGCLVHHEQWDEWYIWSLGHKMTAFGYYVDPSTNEPHMISGDANGNTYVWGEQYTSDNGISIAFHLRSAYHHLDKPYSTKYPDRYYLSLDQADSASLNVAINYSDEYAFEQTFKSGFLAKQFFSNIKDFKTISFEILGSTTTNRPEFYGYTISYKENEDRGEGGSSYKR